MGNIEYLFLDNTLEWKKYELKSNTVNRSTIYLNLNKKIKSNYLFFYHIDIL